eukprot:TRINITY_DN1629_c0_g1_i1.p1 TRINITY_DN1629_c0_g1~~TRINITY_DN1629_c0_g1_i1.p1  ORF type:complete len:116 (-),score=11.64 TRINITY_DN1629_c0_g1_i1:91-438(-)
MSFNIQYVDEKMLAKASESHMSTTFIPPYIMTRKTIEICQRRRKMHATEKKYKQCPGKYCYYCGTTVTTEWRRGPDSKNSLCNACGLRFNHNRKRELLMQPINPPSKIRIVDLLN